MSAQRPRLRLDLVAGPHPENERRCLVHCPRTGQQFETSADGWALAQLCDGRRSRAEIRAAAEQRLALALTPAALLRFLARMEKLGALEGPKAPPPRPAPPTDRAQRSLGPVPAGLIPEVHPQARFLCEGFGTCCESGYVIPLGKEAAAAIRRAALRVLGPSAPDPVTVLPTEPGQAWRLALDNERGCPFLDGEQRCRIHEAPEQPDPCRAFPFAFARFGARLYAAPTHRCLCGQLGRGELLSEQAVNLGARLAASPRVPVLPARTQVDDQQSLPTGTSIRAVHAASHLPGGPFPMLLEAADRLLTAARVPPARRRPLPPVELLARLAASLEIWEDESVWAALRGLPHPLARSIRARQQQRGPISEADPEGEVARFVRDQLYGLRLWEASTLARGLLAIGVAAYQILDRLPRRQVHTAVRLRIMLHEDALTSARLRGLYGAEGPLGARTADLRAVRAQLARLADG